MNIKNRVKELRVASASDLIENEHNWRTHPPSQRRAMTGILKEIGFAAAAIARELPNGKLKLIDGHLRRELAEGGKIPVLVLDVTEEESQELMLKLDPLKDMADTDAAALEKLIASIETESKAVADLLEKIAENAGLGLADDIDPGVSHEDDNAYPDEAAVADAGVEGVRMVQLFLSETNIGTFQHACETLAERYTTSNITDTVLEAMRRASASL